MDPAFLDFIKLLEGGGNVALVAAAWMLWRAVQSLTRIETFMSTLFEVLLRTDGINLRDTDKQLLTRMKEDMRAKTRQGGYISQRMAWGMAIVGLILATLAAVAFAQSASDAARVSWSIATVDVNGAALPDTGIGSIQGTRIQRASNCTASNFGTVAETLNVPKEVTHVLFENLPAGKWCYRARHIAVVAAGAPESASAWSEVVSKQSVKPTGKPARPVSITVE